MDKKLLEELKGMLESERGSIQKELEGFAEQDPNLKNNWDAKYPNRQDADKDEEADEVQEYENMVSLEHSLESKLKEVNDALERMQNGTYGFCENCKKAISEDRLMACPEARTCLQCQK